MKSKILYCSFILSCFFPYQLFSQNLTGTWETKEPGTYMKLVLLQTNDSLFGYTYDVDMGYCKTNFAGIFNKSKSLLKGKGVSFIEHTALHTMSTYNLEYKKIGKDEILEGNAHAKGAIMTALSFGLPIHVKLTKISDSPDNITAFMQKHDSANAINTSIAQILIDTSASLSSQTNNNFNSEIVEAKKRKDSVFKTIETKGVIKLTLYDNGIIDNDTITLFHNDSVVVYHYKLTEKAKVFEFPLNNHSLPQTITLMANNLGSIPPNTALLVIETNGKRYELNLSSDFTINAVVKFVYRE